MNKKDCLGDGVYIEMDNFGFVLTTENGISVTNRIVLDDPTLNALLKWVEQTLAELEAKPMCPAGGPNTPANPRN